MESKTTPRELELYELERRLYIAARFDTIRQARRNDYGCGQRGAELSRLRRRLREAGRSEYPELAPAEALEAFEKYGAPKMRRAENQPAGDGTPYTVEAWHTLRRRIVLAAASPHTLMRAENTGRPVAGITPAEATDEMDGRLRDFAAELEAAKGSDTGTEGGGPAAPPPSSEADPTDSPEFRAWLATADLGRPSYAASSVPPVPLRGPDYRIRNDRPVDVYTGAELEL